MKSLSIKQPWAYAIMHLGKDIENRTRHTKIRGTIGIHASKTIDWDAYYAMKANGYPIPNYEDFPLGEIVGTVEIVDSVEDHKSKWKQDGTIGYVLQNPQPLLRTIPCRGQLGFWDIDELIGKELAEQMSTLNFKGESNNG